MSRLKFLLLLCLVILTLGAAYALAVPLTYVVGTCKPGFQSFPNITAALAATPSPAVIDVCPGTYNEQPVITIPVTLQGISSGDSDQAVIAPPGVGLKPNTTDDFGNSLAVQLWVDNSSGAVNISNITVDGTGNGMSTCESEIVGIFYQNSAGTVNHVTTRNQKGNNCGVGLQLEGGAATPSVTVQNSSIHDFDLSGIIAETNNTTSPQLTATIKTNNINNTSVPTAFGAGYAINILVGTTAMVTGNFLNGGGGIEVCFFGPVPGCGGSVVGSISGNTVMNTSAFGILTFVDGVSITANRLLNNATGIALAAMNGVGASAATIQGNTITDSNIGIDFGCLADQHVSSNTIADASTGVNNVPSGAATPNAYFNVGTIQAGSCP
jgi:hypothetical protein